MQFRTTQRPDDRDTILHLHREGYRGLGWRFGPHCLDKFLALVDATMAEVNLDDRQSNHLWFAEENSKTLGCAALIKRGTKGQLRWVVLLPEARGRGIGKQVVHMATDTARNMGLEEIFLETTDGLDASMSLYKSMGFVFDHASEERLWFGEGRLITMSMRLV